MANSFFWPEYPFKAKASTFEAKASTFEANAFKHTARAEIKIRSTSDSETGYK